MAKNILFCLILVNAFVGLASATDVLNSVVSDPPAPTLSINGENQRKKETPLPRKLGNHCHYLGAASCSPSPAPQVEKKMSSSEQTENEGQEIHLKKHHRSVDKSVAGGGVILGGLATTFLVAVFCYIRATGRHKADSTV